MSIPEGDYEKGKKIFKQRCLQCHVIESMSTKTGPTLNGVIGRKSGQVAGFDYSAANKNKVRLSFIGFIVVRLYSIFAVEPFIRKFLA